MGRIYLHVGTPKTGTTALQDFLPLNQQVLGRYGYSFPEVPFYFRGVAPHQTAHFLAMWEPQGAVREEWDEGFSIMEKSLCDFENVIFSDEQVWWRQHKEGFWEEVTKKVSQMGAELFIVVYLRRQDEQVESFYNEKVKGMPKLSLTFMEYLSEGYNDYFPLHYDTELDRFASYLGEDHIIVRPYEKGQFEGGSIFSDFLSAIGLSLTEEYTIPASNPNTRWPEHIVDAKRYANAALSYHRRKVPNFYRTAIEDAYGIGSSKNLPSQKLGMFSPTERREFMKQYEEGNARVARRFLHRKDGRLFYEDLKELPKWEQDYRTLREDAIRMLAGADTLMFERVNELLSRTDELLSDADAIYNGNFFGTWRSIRKKIHRIKHKKERE